ncbi:hypothetical protein ACFWX5_14595 [[Kitasatospora] papulosa]|uniref:hypothetical protein n=1 Tax=[Kitasatospora] papulosa TaxID=1464011 RepID=UPI003684E595
MLHGFQEGAQLFGASAVVEFVAQLWVVCGLVVECCASCLGLGVLGLSACELVGALVLGLGVLVLGVAAFLVGHSLGVGVDGEGAQVLGPGQDVGGVLGVGQGGLAGAGGVLVEEGAGFLVDAFAEVLQGGCDVVEVLLGGFASVGEPRLEFLEASDVEEAAQ